MKDKIITDATFKHVEESKNPRFVEFFAAWCPHCQHMMPIIVGLEKDYSGKVDFFLVDVDQSPAACEKYGVTGMPTMFFYKKNSAKHDDKITGECAAEDLRKCLDKIK